MFEVIMLIGFLGAALATFLPAAPDNGKDGKVKSHQPHAVSGPEQAHETSQHRRMLSICGPVNSRSGRVA